MKRCVSGGSVQILAIAHAIFLLLSCSTVSRAEGASIYRSFDVASGRAKMLGAYGNIAKDCTIGAVPAVFVRTQPRHGALILRNGKMKIKPPNRCSSVELPILVVIYRAEDKFVGQEEIKYVVQSPAAMPQEHIIKINILQTGKSPLRSKTQPMDL